MREITLQALEKLEQRGNTGASAPVDKDEPYPLYQQVEEWIQHMITSGQWPVHYKLKSESDLARDLSISRGTIRKSIRSMVKKGLLVQVHGKGTFVSSSRLQQPLAQRLISFAEAMREQGLSFKTIVLEKKIIQPTGRIASLLELRDNKEVLYLNRIRTADDVPVIFLENYVAIHFCPILKDIDFEKETLFGSIESKCGLKINWGRRSFEAQVSDKDKSSLLEIAVGTPLLYLEQVVYLKGRVPIECSDVWLRGDKLQLSSIMKR